MRIAFYIPLLTIGGAENVIINLANELALRGHNVDLLVLDDNGPYRSRVSTQVHIVRMCKRRSISALPDIVRYFCQSEPDIFYSAMPYINVLILMARIFSFQRKTSVVITEHFMFSGTLVAPPHMMNVIIAAMAVVLFPFADRLVCVSDGVVQDMKLFMPFSHHKITRIHNPIVTESVMGLLATPSPTDAWLNDKEWPVIASAARMVPAKDQKSLISAFALLRQRRRARLVLMGDGPLMKDLKDQVHAAGLDQDVLFTGSVINPYPYMKKASLFAMSSSLEGFCNVLVEALLCGLPIVSTDCKSGPSEILEDGAYGTLVPVGDVTALANAMDAALSAPHDPERQKLRAMDFTVEKICDQYEIIFGDVLARRRNQ